MKSKIKDVKVIYPDDTEEFKRRVAVVITKVIIAKVENGGLEVLFEKLNQLDKSGH